VDQAAKLSELTGLQMSFGKAMDFQNGAYGVALLSRWPIDDIRVNALPAPTGTEPRVVLTARIQPGETAPAFRMAVTHVDHRADPTQRTAQIAKIRELLPASSASEPEILAGDFNATPDSAVVKGLLTEWADSAEGQDYHTIPADNPRRRIDYIFYRPSTRWRVIESRALDEAVASDHRPVLSVMELRP
jgi:endonuclease/exonuclease/phosphatase family metal-dependent hydrolase